MRVAAACPALEQRLQHVPLAAPQLEEGRLPLLLAQPRRRQRHEAPHRDEREVRVGGDGRCARRSIIVGRQIIPQVGAVAARRPPQVVHRPAGLDARAQAKRRRPQAGAAHAPAEVLREVGEAFAQPGARVLRGRGYAVGVKPGQRLPILVQPAAHKVALRRRCNRPVLHGFIVVRVQEALQRVAVLINPAVERLQLHV